MEDQPSHRTKQIQAMIGFKESKMKDEKQLRGLTRKKFRSIADTIKILTEVLELTLSEHPRRVDVLSQADFIGDLKTYTEFLISHYLENAASVIFKFIKIFYLFSILNIKLIPKHFHHYISQIFLAIIFNTIRNFTIQKNLSISA